MQEEIYKYLLHGLANLGAWAHPTDKENGKVQKNVSSVFPSSVITVYPSISASTTTTTPFAQDQILNIEIDFKNNLDCVLINYRIPSIFFFKKTKESDVFGQHHKLA